MLCVQTENMVYVVHPYEYRFPCLLMVCARVAIPTIELI